MNMKIILSGTNPKKNPIYRTRIYFINNNIVFYYQSTKLTRLKTNLANSDSGSTISPKCTPYELAILGQTQLPLDASKISTLLHHLP
jgi:hypothetical protein